ncbi:GNAT family N-acetyltransferase [Fusibacter sp. 3D3]|uniref:GNAT family N-acetyltransferase n=1 Tax=Fusibacter sp. 3D3 TaxID=1048380 RepID=UPI000853B282|nr:GNAT family N-acetyltransferase [Fusibacter sp. 3D3]GAU77970.1 acetyltransferase [Fusibacter sp. 3D3]
MIIRKAEKADCQEVVNLIKLAIEDMASVYTGYENETQVNETLNALYLKKRTRFSFQNIHVLHYQNNVAGQITAYPAAILPELNKGFEFFYNPMAKDRKAQLEALLASREGFEDEYYIDSLAVYEACRGLGFARHLINEIELIAASAGYKKLSLLVDPDNQNAERLYEKWAFKSDKRMVVLGHSYKHMVKDIG